MTFRPQGLHAVILTVLLCNTVLFAQIDAAKQAIENGDFVRAVNILSESLASRPSADAYLYLGIAYGNMKEFQKAEDILKEGNDRFPDDVRFHNELAGLYLAMKETDKAKDELRQALTVDSANSYASDLLASIDISEGGIETALRYWNKSEQPGVDQILHNSFRTFGSWLVKEAIAFRPARVLRYGQWKTTEARLFQTDNFVNVGLDVEPTRTPDRYNAIVRTTSKTNLISDAFFNLFKGTPYATSYLDFWNIGNSGLNWNSFYRWDHDRHRFDTKLYIPIPFPGILHMSVSEVWRSERWDMTKSIRSEFVDEGRRVAYRSNGMLLSLKHIPHYRFEIEGGLEYVNRYAQGDLPQLATNNLNLGQLFLGSNIRIADGVYKNRLSLIGFASRRSILGNFDFSGGTAELNNRLTISTEDQVYLDWSLKGGTIRGIGGVLPMEQYFVLGLDRHPPNLLRGHTVADHGRYGEGPTGTDFVLGNLDIEHRIVTIPMFNTFNLPYLVIKAEAFLDSAKSWDRTRIFKNTELLVDTGAGLRFETPTMSFNVLYGRNLRDGNSIVFGFVERRLW